MVSGNPVYMVSNTGFLPSSSGGLQGFLNPSGLRAQIFKTMYTWFQKTCIRVFQNHVYMVLNGLRNHVYMVLIIVYMILNHQKPCIHGFERAQQPCIHGFQNPAYMVSKTLHTWFWRTSEILYTWFPKSCIHGFEGLQKPCVVQKKTCVGNPGVGNRKSCVQGFKLPVS